MTPLESFNRFLELTSDFETIRKCNPDEIFKLIDTFLVNAGQHREHVLLMTEAAVTLKIASDVGLTRWPLSLLTSKKISKQYIEKIARLKKLLIVAAQPGEFSLDVLPSRIVLTPSEWQGRQLHLVEIRVGIHPFHNLIPEKVSVSLEVPSHLNVQFIDSIPSTAFSDAGQYEIGVTAEGKFTNAIAGAAGVNVDTHNPLLKLSARTSVEAKAESSSIQSKAFRFKFQSFTPKTISSAVANKARWEFLRTPDQHAIGLLQLNATLLAPSTLTECEAEVKLSVALADWGEIPLSLSRPLRLSSVAPGW